MKQRLSGIVVWAAIVILWPMVAASQVDELIVGAWEWLVSDCDHGEIVLTPATEGYTVQTVFTGPADGLRYRRFKDRELFEEGTYVISSVSVPPSGIIVHVIDITMSETVTRYANVRIFEDLDAGTKYLTMVDGLCGHFWKSRGPVTIEQSSWGAFKAHYQ